MKKGDTGKLVKIAQYSEGYLETTSHTYAKEAVNKGHLVIVSVGKSR